MTGDRSPPAAPLRIVFAVARFPSISQTFILRQITTLLDLGHDVRIVAGLGSEDDVVHPAVRTYGLMSRVTRTREGGDGATSVPGLPDVIRSLVRNPSSLTLLRKGKSGAGLGGRRGTMARLAALTRLRHVDVLHCHFGNVGLRYAPIAERLRIPLVTSFYGYDCTQFVERHGSQVYEPLFRVADRVTVLSEPMRQRLVELGCPPERLEKLHLGVDPSEFSYRDRVAPSPDQPVRILSVARLVEKKGITYVLDALAALLDSGDAALPELRYDVVGDGPLRAELEARATELGIDHLVRFHGSRDQKEIRDAMAGAHVFVLPSVTAASGDQEGTPTVLVEASCSGLPVISTWHSGIPEIVLDGETGFLVPERDVNALAERLRALVTSPERWSVMGRAGRRHIEAEFDVRKLTGQQVALYQDVRSDRPMHAAGAWAGDQ